MTFEDRRRERDRLLIRAMMRHGIVDPRTTLFVARNLNRRHGHLPLSRACALLEMESGGGANVWGRGEDEHGPVPPLGGAVTRASYLAYLRRRRRDGRRQGCGPTQLASVGSQDEADRLGGCWQPGVNMYVGFSHLAKSIALNGVEAGIWAYGGAGEDSRAYAEDMLAREARWRGVFEDARPSEPRPVAHPSRVRVLVPVLAAPERRPAGCH